MKILQNKNVTVHYLQNKGNNVHREIRAVTRAREVLGCRKKKGTKHGPTIPNIRKMAKFII